jgi:tetratricopeptide (TPR) repeat protein
MASSESGSGFQPQRAAQLQPGYVVYYNLARLYSRDPDRVDEAKQMYRQTIEINPEYAVAWTTWV